MSHFNRGAVLSQYTKHTHKNTSSTEFTEFFHYVQFKGSYLNLEELIDSKINFIFASSDLFIYSWSYKGKTICYHIGELIYSFPSRPWVRYGLRNMFMNKLFSEVQNMQGKNSVT